MNGIRRVFGIGLGSLVMGFVFLACSKAPEGPVTISGTIEQLDIEEQSKQLVLKDATWTLNLEKAEYAMGTEPMKLDVPKHNLPDFTSLTLAGTVINQSSQTIPKVILRFEAIGTDLPRPWNGESELLLEKSQGSEPTPDCFAIGPGESKSFRFHTAYREPKHVHVSDVRGALIESQ